MMLCIDGSDIASLVCALVEREGDELRVLHEQQVSRTLGDELGAILAFCDHFHVAQHDIDAVGVVIGPGSAGALRSTLSLVNAWALGRGLLVTTVECKEGVGGRVWGVAAHDKPFVLPVYDRPVHTTPSHKDALGRKV